MNTAHTSEAVSSTSKWLISLMSGFIFFIIASPFLFKLTQRFIAKPLGLSFADSQGPTLLGVGVHAVVFMLIVRLMMIN
jgi:hypothetical protein